MPRKAWQAILEGAPAYFERSGFQNNMVLQALEERFREQYGDEYTNFLLIDFGPPPRVCPYCRAETIRKLWLGDPGHPRNDSVWGKWYMWCETCLRGIYCPLGSYIVPVGQPYVVWGDPAALKKALPQGLRLIEPFFPPSSENERKKLQ